MEAADNERGAEGQDGKDDVSDDSDSGEVIIELDQSQIASPSESEEEEGEVDKSPSNPEASYNKTAESEYFDAVSDIEDLPDDEVKPMPASGEGVATEPTTEVSADSGEISTDEKPTGDSADHLSLPSQGPPAAAQDSGDVTHKVRADSDSWPRSSSGSGDLTSKDLLTVQQNVLQKSHEGRTKKSSSAEEVPTVIPCSSIKEKKSKESKEAHASRNVSAAKDDSALSQEGVSSATAITESPSKPIATTPPAAVSEEEAATLVTSAVDFTAGAEAMSDVSSDGEIPLSPVVEDEDKPSTEKLSQQAAHQAEALAPLGAEPVSDPESGEDMGSDESSSPVPSLRFGSPAVVTSSVLSRLGGGFRDARALITSRSPGKSAVVSDSASSLLLLHPMADRLSSIEDAAIPTTIMSSTSDNKLDLSASLDMENISDDENLGEDNDSDDSSGEIEDEADSRQVEEAVTSSTTQPEVEEGQKCSAGAGEKGVGMGGGGGGERVRRPIMIASLGDKQQVQTHFNEEQVELDYEDVDGDGDAEADEGEIKPEDEDDGKEVGVAVAL